MKNLLILDLDETLIFATENELSYKHDFKAYRYYVYKRPYLDEFLEEVFRHFKVAVWTSSDRLYAKKVVNNIFKEDQQLEFLYTNEKCTVKFDFELQDYYHLKKLKKLKKNYNIKNILIIDDTPSKASQNYGNYIRLKEFEGEKEDDELKLLKDYVIKFKDCENVRHIEKRQWKREGHNNDS